MKNIHILPTDKPSNVVISTIDGKLKLNNNINDDVEYHGENQYTYITNNEEIKEGDWFLTDDRRVEKFTSDCRAREWHKKIILTTDLDLIKEGVQKINDNFLEWFVKNPSCEFVKIENTHFVGISGNFIIYKIIIPKEEPKQETLEAFHEINHKIIEKLMAEKKLMYSEEEVYKLTLESLDLGMQIRQDQLNGSSDKSGKELHKEWFETFKKK